MQASGKVGSSCPPKGTRAYEMSSSKMDIYEQIMKTGRLTNGQPFSQSPNAPTLEPPRARPVLSWGDDAPNPPSRKYIPPGQPNRAPPGSNQLLPQEIRSRRTTRPNPNLDKQNNGRKKDYSQVNPYDSEVVSRGERAANGLPTVKTLATREMCNQLVVCALHFGQESYPRGMTYADIVKAIRGAYIVPNTPNFTLGLTSALSKCMCRGLVSKSHGLSMEEARFKLLYYNGPDCGLSICGSPISEITTWPNGHGLPGGASFMSRPPRMTCASIIKHTQDMLALSKEQRYVEPAAASEKYYKRLTPKNVKVPPLKLPPGASQNPMYTQSFADRAGGLESLKPDKTQRPNTPVSGSSEDCGLYGGRFGSGQPHGLTCNEDDGLFDEPNGGLSPAPPGTAVEEPDLYHIPGMGDGDLTRARGHSLDTQTVRNWLEHDDLDDYALASNWRGPDGGSEVQELTPWLQTGSSVQAEKEGVPMWKPEKKAGNNQEFDPNGLEQTYGGVSPKPSESEDEESENEEDVDTTKSMRPYQKYEEEEGEFARVRSYFRDGHDLCSLQDSRPDSEAEEEGNDGSASFDISDNFRNMGFAD